MGPTYKGRIMNQHIFELIQQQNGDCGLLWTEEDKEKFAELIVRECIRVPYDMWDKAELNADVAVKIEHRIKEHFGVE